MTGLFQGSTFEEYKEYLDKVGEKNQNVAMASAKLLRNDKYISEVMEDLTLTEREYIEVIASCRQINYNKAIGGANKAAENETDRLYAKNAWKFVEEFLQNADDCDYSETPEIDIIIDERDINHPLIEFAYNEDGFQRSDVWAITAFSESTKINDTVKKQEEIGVFYKEKTGRKGKGFKSVFSLQSENVIVHIRSNGFSFKLDNKIGRIMPVWEDDPDRMDKRTHVIVELVNPEFKVKDIYPEFRRLFCIDKVENIFASSPFLFMHRMRSVHIARIGANGTDEFITEYKEKAGSSIYSNPITINRNKIILAGIANAGTYYKEQVQEGWISTYADNCMEEIPVIRYTRMVEDSEYYRNYSIIAPIITSESSIKWENGALFRTFPMSLHTLKMPISIDAPFILNPDRSGVQYSSYKDEEGTIVPASEWNTFVTNRLFEKNGVLEEFFLRLRAVNGVRIDNYIRSDKVMLFSDRNNSDGHGNTFIPLINISELTKAYPLFHSFADADCYISFNDAVIVNKDLFNWPCISTLFMLMFGPNYTKQILSDLYVGSSLFTAKSIVREGFVEAINAYLDEVDQQLGLESDDMVSFVNGYLYPYLRNNYVSISKTTDDAFKKLAIYYSKVQDGRNIHVVREAYDGGRTKWVHSKNRALLSINRYRVFESSPVNMEIIKQITDSVLWSRDLDTYFADNNINKIAKNCKSWNEIRDMIEAVYYFDYSTKNLWFQNLDNYVLSEKLDPGFNAFRSAGVVEVIDDEDVWLLAGYSDDIDKTIQELKRMGLKKPEEYYEENGNYLNFRKDTLKVLTSDKCTADTLKDLCKIKKVLNKDVNATYEMVAECSREVLLFFLNEENKLFSTDSYADICEAVQANEVYWNMDKWNEGDTGVLVDLSKDAFYNHAGKPVSFIALEDDYEVYDEGLFDCYSLLIGFEDVVFQVKSQRIGCDRYGFIYGKVSPGAQTDVWKDRIEPSEEEPLVFVREEQEPESSTALRFIKGSRPILATADDGSVTIGFSHFGENEEWIEYADHRLLGR